MQRFKCTTSQVACAIHSHVSHVPTCVSINGQRLNMTASFSGGIPPSSVHITDIRPFSSRTLVPSRLGHLGSKSHNRIAVYPYWIHVPIK